MSEIIGLVVVIVLLMGLITIFMTATALGKQAGKPEEQTVKPSADSTSSPPGVDSASVGTSPANTQPLKYTKPTWTTKYAYIYNDVSLFIPDGRAPEYDKLALGDSATLVPEPENEYDDGAVFLQQNGEFIGYIHRGKLQDMANDFIRAGFQVDAELFTYNRYKHEVSVILMFPYKNPNTVKAIKMVKLVGNTNEDMQDDIASCEPGDVVTFDYDYDKEKYLVCAGPFEIGYLPAKAEEYIGDDGGDAIIDRIEENDNGKYVVKIAIKP